MTSSRRFPLKTFFFITLMVIFGPLGNVLLSKGMKSIGSIAGRSPAELAHVFVQVISSGTIWLGIASLLTFFVANMLILTWADYSYILPASAAGYGTVALLGHFLLGEAVSPLRWVGISIICTGVLVVGFTSDRTHRPSKATS